ncbi:hypothetical protein GIB67_030517, partial [Kingdonia uniflora]
NGKHVYINSDKDLLDLWVESDEDPKGTVYIFVSASVAVGPTQFLEGTSKVNVNVAKKTIRKKKAKKTVSKVTVNVAQTVGNVSVSQEVDKVTQVCLSGDDMDGDAGDGDVSSEAGDGEPIIGDDMHGDDMNGDANNMEIDKENDNENIVQMDGDDIPSIEDFRRCGEFEELIRESENIFQVEEEEAYKKQPQSGYDKFKCEEEECSLYVYVRRTNDGYTMILRGGNFDHSCSGKLDYGNRLTNAQWVANDCEEMVRDVKIVTPADIITRIRRVYGVNISYYTVWNAKTICVEMITGCFDEGYSIMQELCRQVLLSNPGTPFLTMYPSKLTLILDRQKGSVESVSQIFPQQNHRFCFRHMWKNFKKEFRGLHLERLCWGAANAFLKSFLINLKEISLMLRFCSEYHMVVAYRRSYKGSVLRINDPLLWEKRVQTKNNPPTRVGVGIGVGVRVGVGMRGRGTRGGVVRGRAARGSEAVRVHTQASRQSTNNVIGGLTSGGAARVHIQPSQQSTNNARGGLTRGGAARVHTQASQQSTNNARGGLTRGGTLFSQPSQGSGITQASKNVNPYKKVCRPTKDKWLI